MNESIGAMGTGQRVPAATQAPQTVPGHLPRLDGIEALRGSAAIAVMLFHACVLSVDYLGSALFDPAMVIGNAGVDLFFVISGFVMAYTTWPQIGRPGLPVDFAVNRLSRIYPPYWVLTAMVFLYWLHNPAGVNAKTGGVDLWNSWLLLPSKDKLPLVPVAWTLVYEVFFYLVFWALLCTRRPAVLLIALAGWALAVIAHGVTARGALQISAVEQLVFSPLNLEFVLGAFLGIAYHRHGEPRSSWPVALGMAIFAVEAWYFHRTGQANFLAAPERVALFLPPAAMIVWGMLGASSRWPALLAILVRTGAWSYSLYLTHILVIHLIYRLASRRLYIDGSTPVQAATMLVVAVSASLLVGQLFHRWIERPVSLAARQGLRRLLVTT